MSRPRNWDPHKMFDISHEEQRAIAERAKMRQHWKLEFQKKVGNPHVGTGGYIVDPAVQRFLAMRSNHFDHFKATPKTAAFGFFGLVVPFFGMWYLMAKDKRELEEQCRTGKIAYTDRLWKAI